MDEFEKILRLKNSQEWIEFEKYYCVWLPKNKQGQLVEIVPKTKEEILKKLEELGI